MNNLMEYTNCRNNIFYFMQKYLNIECKGFQFHIITSFLNVGTNKIENILGHRGCGLTTMSCVYALWRALFHADSAITFYCTISRFSKNIKNTFQDLYKILLKNWDLTQYNCSLESINEWHIKFDNKSCIYFTYAHEQLRGKHFDTIFYDSPYLIYEFNEEIFAGTGNYFILNTSLPPIEHGLEKIGTLTTYPWYVDSNHTLNWYLKMLNSLGKTEFMLNYGCTRGNSNVEYGFRQF